MTVPVDGAGEEYEVGSEECVDQGERDGGRLVDDKQLALPQLVRVRRVDVSANTSLQVSGGSRP